MSVEAKATLTVIMICVVVPPRTHELMVLAGEKLSPVEVGDEAIALEKVAVTVRPSVEVAIETRVGAAKLVVALTLAEAEESE